MLFEEFFSERFWTGARAIRTALLSKVESMTIDELMNEASQACIDEREAYLVMFTEGLNGYVCRNDASAIESRALFKGTYRECQVWVERRGIVAALRVVKERWDAVDELTNEELAGRQVLEQLMRLP